MGDHTDDLIFGRSAAAVAGGAGAAAVGYTDQNINLEEAPHDRQHDGFRQVPDELLEVILSFVGSRHILMTVPRVCKRWRHAARSVAVVVTPVTPPEQHAPHPLESARALHSQLPHNLKLFQSIDIDVVGRWLLDLAARYHKIIQLAPLCGVSSPFEACLPDTAVAEVVASCSHLDELFVGWDLPGDEVDTALVLAAVSRHCPRIRSVEVWRDDLTDLVVANLVAACHGLTHITLKANATLSDEALVAIGANCPCLNRLRFACIEKDTAQNRRAITDRGVVALAHGCRHLAELSFVDGPVALTDVSLVTLGERCHALKCIRLWCHPASEGISDIGVAALARGCTNLQTLSFTQVTAMTDASMAALAASCRRLSRIRVRGTAITSAGVICIANSCPELTCVDFSETAVTDSGLIHLVERCRHLKLIDGLLCNQLTDGFAHFLIANRQRNFSIMLDGSSGISKASHARLRQVFRRDI
jgi:hypothetical protein